MDPVSLIVAAVVAGASAGAKDLATTVVKDAYAGLKGLLTRREVDVSALERRPDSNAQQTALSETLTETPGAVDDELLGAAKSVVDAIVEQAPDVGAAIGVDLERIRAEFLQIGTVRSDGTGVRVRDGEFSGGIDIGRVEAGPVAADASGDPSER